MPALGGRIDYILDSLSVFLWVFGCCAGPIFLFALFIGVGNLLGWFKPYKETHKAERKRATKGLGHNLDELARRLGMPADQLAAFEPGYKTATIPKKRGGTRTLHIPDTDTKALQRTILRRLLRHLKTHDAATGFDPGISIAHNAGMHTRQAVVIKLDIKDFFPSTTAARVDHYFRRIGWDAECAALLTRLVTHNGGLPQGAPTSPRLSNLVNYVLDCQIQRYVDKHKGSYTRYADDITVSYPKDWPRYVRGTVQVVRRVCRKHGYTVHTRGKLRIVRRHQQQRVTGLVVNDKVALPRAKRRWLRAVEHRLATGGEASLTQEQLDGYKALQHMIATQTGPYSGQKS